MLTLLQRNNPGEAPSPARQLLVHSNNTEEPEWPQTTLCCTASKPDSHAANTQSQPPTRHLRIASLLADTVLHAHRRYEPPPNAFGKQVTKQHTTGSRVPAGCSTATSLASRPSALCRPTRVRALQMAASCSCNPQLTAWQTGRWNICGSPHGATRHPHTSRCAQQGTRTSMLHAACRRSLH